MIEMVAHILVLAGLLISAILIFHFSDLMAAALASGFFSFLISLEFYILQAPDVAIAQAAVGACLSTAILIIAVKATKRMDDEQ